MLHNFIDSVLIIDNQEDEIKELKELLEERDIWVRYLHPNECNKQVRNRKLIFLDLFLEKTAGNQILTHISKIRKILTQIIGKEDGTYGIVVWTNHDKHIEAFNDIMVYEINAVAQGLNLFKDIDHISRLGLSIIR